MRIAQIVLERLGVARCGGPQAWFGHGIERALHVVCIRRALGGNMALEHDLLSLRDLELRALDPVGQVGLEEREEPAWIRHLRTLRERLRGQFGAQTLEERQAVAVITEPRTAGTPCPSPQPRIVGAEQRADSRSSRVSSASASRAGATFVASSRSWPRACSPRMRPRRSSLSSSSSAVRVRRTPLRVREERMLSNAIRAGLDMCSPMKGTSPTTGPGPLRGRRSSPGSSTRRGLTAVCRHRGTVNHRRRAQKRLRCDRRSPSLGSTARQLRTSGAARAARAARRDSWNTVPARSAGSLPALPRDWPTGCRRA